MKLQRLMAAWAAPDLPSITDNPPANFAPPCAQPMDSLSKHLFIALIVVMAAVVVSINMPRGPAPLACTAQIQK